MKPVFLSPAAYGKKANKSTKGQAVALAVTEALRLSPSGTSIDRDTGGLVSRALSAAKFKGKAEQVTRVVAPSGLPYEQILIVGLGEEGKLDALAWEKAGGTLAAKANMMGVSSLTVILDTPPGKHLKKGEAEARLAFGAALRSYRFAKYRTQEKPEEKPTFASLAIVTPDATAAEKTFAPLDALRQGMFLTRDIVSEPPNVLYPESLAAICRGLEQHGVTVEILGEKEMKKLGMGALLGVGQGSVRESQLVVMQWNGAGRKEKPIAFVGKGVCFDSGGISIKPSKGMDEMKWDMGGAGAVIGLMQTLALRKAKVNAVGIGGLVENMPDGGAQRPGDIVTSMSGQTIEVLNTDAEGRLVLADALWYVQEQFAPQAIIDLATLTGAIIVALGHEYAGLFANDDTLAKRLAESGESSGEKLWRFPLSESYNKLINSPVADMQNIGPDRDAGSITAAQFLQRFIKEKTPWAHLDIAGTAWAYKDQPTCPKGASAFGVRLLDTLVREYYEKR